MNTTRAVWRATLAVAALCVALAAPAQVPNPNCPPDIICPEWSARYDASALYDHAFDIAVSSDGARVYVTGASTSTAGGQDFATVAYDAATGAQLWVARYDGPSHATDVAAAVVVSADGNRVFVTGWSATPSGKSDYVTIAYRATDGGEIWNSTHATPQDSQAKALVLSGDGQRLYVTGWSALAIHSTIAVPDYDYGTVAYDTATGQELWRARYQGPAAFWDTAYAIVAGAVTQPDGSRREQVFVTGRSNGQSTANNHADYLTAAYDGLTGAAVWSTRYNGPGNDRDVAYGVGVSPDGTSVFVTGESIGSGTSSDYATLSYDSLSGAQRWVTRYERPDLDLSLGLAVSPGGDRVAVTGFSVNPVAGVGVPPIRDAATIVYNAETGAEVWAARHSEPDGAAASQLQFSRDGRHLYVAGLENGNVVAVGGGPVGGQVGHAPALTIAYDAVAGTEVWATHYNGPGGDEGNSAIEVSSDGAHVFVAGGGQSQAADFATISYPTGQLIPAVADLAVAKTHAGDFFRGQEGATYTITATNVGAGTTSGVVTVADSLPSGLTATAISGPGWTCDLSPLTCSRSDVLAAGGSHPAITVTVNVDADAPATVTNTVSISGGGQSNTSNDTAADPTMITAPPPALAALTPAEVCQGAAPFVMTIEGSDFVDGAVAQIDGAGRPTTFGDSAHLQASFSADDTADAGAAVIRVVNPDGKVSNALTLTIATDTTGPAVTPPPAFTTMQSLCIGGSGGASGATVPGLANYLDAGNATDGCTAPTRLAPQVDGSDADDSTVFRAGTTLVTFRFVDGTGNIGGATSTVTVRLYGDLNLDDATSAEDLVIFANYLAQNVSPGTPPFASPLSTADVNADGKVDIVDLVMEANYLVANIECLGR